MKVEERLKQILDFNQHLAYSALELVGNFPWPSYFKVIWSLSRLERAGYIESKRIGFRRYYIWKDRVSDEELLLLKAINQMFWKVPNNINGTIPGIMGLNAQYWIEQLGEVGIKNIVWDANKSEFVKRIG